MAGFTAQCWASAQVSYGALADGCTGCHGTRGLGAPYMPTIAGLNEAYLRKVMEQYKTGERPSTIMGRVARGYSEKEIDALAAYFAAQTWISPVQEVDDGLVARGEKVHQKQCEMCHKDNGRFMDEKTPRIAGQGIDFLKIALEEYQDEQRRVMQKYMKKLMERLRGKDLDALAHFYASQK